MQQQNNFVRNNWGNFNQFQINFNFNFFGKPEGPKFKFPIKKLLGLVWTILGLLSTGQAPVTARPVQVTITSPTSNTTYAVGDSVTFTARATSESGKITSVGFRGNGKPIGQAVAHPSTPNVHTLKWVPRQLP